MFVLTDIYRLIDDSKRLDMTIYEFLIDGDIIFQSCMTTE